MARERGGDEYASDVANSIKFFVGEEWVDASSDAPMDVISIFPGMAQQNTE
jgi:hypothetical protein